MNLIRRLFREVWSPEPLQDPCLICGRTPTCALEVREVRVRGFSDFEWGKCGGPFCREHGVARSRAWLARTLTRGWWNPSAFFPNFLALAYDVVAFTKLLRSDRPGGGPVPGTLASLTENHPGALGILAAMQEGLGEQAWRNRATYLPPTIEASMRGPFLRLIDAERWSLVKNDWDELPRDVERLWSRATGRYEGSLTRAPRTAMRIRLLVGLLGLAMLIGFLVGLLSGSLERSDPAFGIRNGVFGVITGGVLLAWVMSHGRRGGR